MAPESGLGAGSGGGVVAGGLGVGSGAAVSAGVGLKAGGLVSETVVVVETSVVVPEPTDVVVGDGEVVDSVVESPATTGTEGRVEDAVVDASLLKLCGVELEVTIASATGRDKFLELNVLALRTARDIQLNWMSAGAGLLSKMVKPCSFLLVII